MQQTKILLVDDDRLILATLTKILEQNGYRVIPAANGEEALQKGINEEIILAIVDIRLPDASGIAVARRLREEAGLFSLFLTAYDDTELVEQAANEGALGYLLKPIDARQIIPALRTAIERKKELCRLIESEANLSQALEKNRNISVAIGILMERSHCNDKGAFEALRSYARSERRKLSDVADELVHATGKRNGLIGKIQQTIGKASPAGN